ncbi:hypothetical protein I3842_01G092600 [Carya illinoinensis]|uniref:Uncharacterized protein n=1 Tax=Carya illinoinensis TaxID=32201 RepID=A0A922K4G0_CARIL|nr:hypothetical protein I3842_01G092600 [Carya illinoinensis]
MVTRISSKFSKEIIVPCNIYLLQLMVACWRLCAEKKVPNT